MTAKPAAPNLDDCIGRLQPLYDSAGQAEIGRMLDRYGIPFFYRQPTLICENGRRTIWRPDFTLPTYNNIVIEYDPAPHRALAGNNHDSRRELYRLNGVEALLLDASDLAKPDWQQRLYERLEQSYRQPLAYLRERSPSRRG